MEISGRIMRGEQNKPECENVKMWKCENGASVDTSFVQIAITGREKGETVWLEVVTDDEYNNK